MDINEIKEQAKLNAKKAASSAKNKVAAMKRESLYEEPEYTGDIEKDCELELDAVQQGFRDRIKKEANRFKQATDSEYWFAVCFQTREQKEVFLKAMELIEHGDKYLDGQYVAEKLGVELPEADIKYLAEGKIDKDFEKLAL